MNYILYSISELDSFSKQPQEINSLDMSLLDFNTFPETVLTFTNLHRLILTKGTGILRRRNFITLPDQIDRLSELEQLEMNHCGIVKLPASFSNLKQMQQLIISANPLGELPIEILQLKKLEKLDMTFCEFESFPINLIHLPALKELYLGSDYFTLIPEQVSEFLNLERLSIQECILDDRHIESSLNNLSKIAQLKFLDLRGIGLKEIPECILNMKNLRVLDVSRNPLNSDTVRKLENSEIEIIF